MRFRFQHGIKNKQRPITNQRLAAAKRALKKQRDKYALFPDVVAEIAAEQPTPEQRIVNHDTAFAAGHANQRQHRAQLWRQARKQLAAMPERERIILIDAWNRSGMPASPENLLGHLHRYLPDCQKRFDAGERWFVFNPYGDRLVVLLWTPAGAERVTTKIAGPFEDYLDAIKAMEELCQLAKG